MTPANLKKCDIVMKGGITSGIVYPGTVCKLAERYEFENIGGTSAGAIAACVTAAAEYSRRSGKDVFDRVAQIPGWLGGKSATRHGSNLFNLFQPQPGVKNLYRFATGFLIKGWFSRIAVWVRALWLEMLFGIAPGAILIYLSSNDGGWRRLAVVSVGLLVIAGGILLMVSVGILLRAARLPSHHYGFCTGYTEPVRGRPPSLVGWLSEQIDTLAGMTEGHPLTFGDLEDAGIKLRLITTSLTFGRPYTLPFESAEFYYSPLEMRRFFPDKVVAWMESHPASPSAHGEIVDTGELRPLPDQKDLPVIVAARLSLSFPLLFCAVPLYAVDWTRRRRDKTEPAPGRSVPGDAIGPDEARKPERVWFSDGGICSNFPIHLFDSPIPRWPTFGINLADLRADRTTAKDRTWIPRSAGSGIAHQWTRLSTKFGLGGDGGFVAAMFNAARNWMDNLQATVPGYRDRIVTVYLDAQEGGLNLNMSQENIAALNKYGEIAAEKLIEHFIDGRHDGEPTPMTWDNHRWIRYRSTMAQLDHFLTDFNTALEEPEPGDSSYFTLIDRGAKEPPNSYRFTQQQREHATQLTLGLQRLSTDGNALEADAPRPKPTLEVRPRF